MWKLGLLFALSFSLTFSPATTDTTGSLVTILEEMPPYAKWGRVAVQETKEKYPDAAIVDYLHIGRETANGKTTEKFKLWLRESNREFGVFIDIEFNTETEEVIHITFQETDR